MLTKEQSKELRNLSNKFYHSLMDLGELESVEEVKVRYKQIVNDLENSNYTTWVKNFVKNDSADVMKLIEAL